MITANELKTRGVKAIAEVLEHREEVGITVRGKVKYVVMSVEEYDKKRFLELDLALREVEEDIKNGDYKKESAKDHIKRLWND